MNAVMVDSTYNDSRFDPVHARGVESVLNAVMLANGSDWETEFKALLQEVKQLCLMPDNVKCVKAYLAANGFIQQPGTSQRVLLEDVVAGMERLCDQGQEAIVALTGTPTDYVLVSPRIPGSKAENSGYRAYGFRKPHYRTDVTGIWVRWQDREDHSPVKRRKYSGSKKSTRKQPADHERFHYCQKNPKEFTGDCVIRAIAGACDLSWEETMDRLARQTGYQSTTVNLPNIYEPFLKQLGFEKRPAMTPDGRRLNGREFCKELDRVLLHGQVVFAYVGANHVAAVLPFTEDGVTRYKIVDSWDSTGRRIGEYWVRSEQTVRAQETAKRLCCVGSRIIHPVFGEGKVTELHSGYANVRFDAHGERILGTKWIADHCRPAV